MEHADFKPQNDLEKTLLTLLDGSMEGEDFLHYLMDAQVYMPILDETPAIMDFQRSTQTQPLLVDDEEHTRMLILFTSTERSKDFVSGFPGYGGGLLIEFSWVLRKMDRALAIALNPGLEAGFDMDAETVASMMAELPPESQ
ncbi:MAG: hypothetical protein B7Y56_05045 [Gallionellales bacterium 35-53-114]|jgi:hypothetical protein|nr:MAG: hypothetical protein B7Y56_05045 [Gallionellales bacterium 35-53-114]OYZ65451.1 MAG: hypothetical protein B7Y04_02200 [Gallionellales bacterium 24-53-125]OZB08357.1 MAG: hypothetical protein B7X61_12655 [Gallionellales bacterium 39-52-133]HQS58300.1 SseB family protein [Gallionellaceae bacterium]HQS73855.1 SseB family protein [Gallionellaceae bacterium]